MKKALFHTFPAIAATVLLAAQPVAAQDRSEEYKQGYRDATCHAFEKFAPIFMILAPMMMAENPEVGTGIMVSFTTVADECGIDWTPAASETTPQLAPEPTDPARCERLAGLIAPLDAEIDRLLASSTDSGTLLAIAQTQGRRRDIEREMERAGC